MLVSIWLSWLSSSNLSRWKAKEVDYMREKVPLATLSTLIKAAQPARDFRGAVLRRAAETGTIGLVRYDTMQAQCSICLCKLDSLHLSELHYVDCGYHVCHYPLQVAGSQVLAWLPYMWASACLAKMQ